VISAFFGFGILGFVLVVLAGFVARFSKVWIYERRDEVVVFVGLASTVFPVVAAIVALRGGIPWWEALVFALLLAPVAGLAIFVMLGVLVMIEDGPYSSIQSSVLRWSHSRGTTGLSLYLLMPYQLIEEERLARAGRRGRQRRSLNG
jgi:hypothetical protein